MSKRKLSSQKSIDIVIKLNQELRESLIRQLYSFNQLEHNNLLDQLTQLLKFKLKKSSNIYSDITTFEIQKIINVLCKLNCFNIAGNSLSDEMNKLKEEVIDNLVNLDAEFESNEDIVEDTDLDFDNYIINDEQINGEQINGEQINGEQINGEQINESNYNNMNESIDEIINSTINISTNKKPIEESLNNEKLIDKSSNIDHKMIEDLFPLIFEYLSIDDLFNCRLVNKQFKKLSDNTNGINKLIIGEPNLDFDNFYWIYRPNFYDYFWFYNNTKIEDKDLISSKCFKRINLLSIFNLVKNLKYLKIYDSQFQLTEISNLINLESLEFGHLYRNNQQIINSNNLKFLALNDKLVKLNTPKLEKIQSSGLSYIASISNPELIKHLITKDYNFNKLKMFKKLEIIELRHFECKTINENLLIIFKNLKQLKINLNFSKVQYSDERIKNGLIKILTDKIKLKKEIDIYLEGIKIENINKFNELINIANFNQSFNSRDYSYWKFVLDNYNLLDLNVSFIEFLDYSYLEKHFNNLINDLPDDFFDKFHRINRIDTFKIKDVDGLKWFLNNLKYLSTLYIGSKVSLGQNFYDYNLPNTIKCLYIYNEEDVNYDFILKLSKLIKLNTFIDKDLFDLAFTSFLNLKYLNYFRFYFNKKDIEIKRKDKCFYLNQLRTKLEYNQLIEKCNKIRSNKNQTKSKLD